MLLEYIFTDWERNNKNYILVYSCRKKERKKERNDPYQIINGK
jgi:hypothetical protein